MDYKPHVVCHNYILSLKCNVISATLRNVAEFSFEECNDGLSLYD